MKWFLITMMVLLWTSAAIAQVDTLGSDSGSLRSRIPSLPRNLEDVTQAPLLDSFQLREPIKENLTRVIFSFDNSRSLFHRPSYAMNGFRLGVEMRKKTRFGLVFNTVGDSLRMNLDTPDSGGATRLSQEFSVLSLFYEYIAFSDYKWEVSFPFSVGVGSGTISYFDGNNDNVRLENVEQVSMFSAGAAAHYKIIPWLGVGTGFGFRQLTTPQDVFRENLSSPYYVLKVKFFFGHVVKSVFNPEVVKAEKAAYQEQKAARRAVREARRQASADAAN